MKPFPINIKPQAFVKCLQTASQQTCDWHASEDEGKVTVRVMLTVKQATYICFYFFPRYLSFWQILLKGEVDRCPCITSPGNECCFIDLLVTNDSGLSASTTRNKWDVLYWNSTLHSFRATRSVISYRMPLGCFFKNCCLQIEFTNNLLLTKYFRKALKWEIDDKAWKEWWWGIGNISTSQVPRDITEKDRKIVFFIVFRFVKEKYWTEHS